MFDLFRSRDKAVRILLGVILGVVALSMITYLIPGAGSTGMTASDDNVIAKIGDEQVTAQSALQAVNMAMRGRQIPQEMIGFLGPQVVQSLINERAMSYEAKRLGLQISDDDINLAVRSQLPAAFIDKNGKINQDALAQALAQQNLTVEQFLDETRRSLLANRLRQLVQSGIVISKSEAQQEFTRRNEKTKVSYALVKPSSVEQQVQVTPAELQAHYAKNKNAYQVAEKKNLAIVVLDSAKVGAAIEPSDADLHTVYNASLDRFRTPERVKVRHILIPIDPTTTDAQAQAKAADLLKQAQAGADFAELAKKNSKDPGSASKGGDVGFIARGQMVKPFEDAAFSLKPGQLSGLVKTSYGYHILRVEEREDARVKSFDEVKPLLSTEYKKRKVNEVMQQLADKAVVNLKKDPSHPEKAAEEARGELVRVENVKSGDPIPQVGISQDLQNAIGGLKQGAVSNPITVPVDKLAIVRVVSVTPAHPATLDEVRTQVESEVRRQKIDDLVQKRVNDLAAKAKAEGGDLAKAAKEMGIEVKESADFNRQGAIEGLGAASMLSDAFTAKDGSILGPLNSADGKAVVKVLSHTPADTTGFSSQEAALRDEMKAKVARERMSLFEDGVRKQLEKDGKIKVQQDALNRLLQNMRS